jgi:2-polyprenyl-3-methyl-5-hydroxy-6-metoxy-1,4-benzoquinol methylase
MAELGARVVAFDYSAEFIARARERTSKNVAVEYHVVDAANRCKAGVRWHDMPDIPPIMVVRMKLMP